MLPKECVLIHPAPYFKIAFGCSNRAFHTVKSTLVNIADDIDEDAYSKFVSETCDYEGDLETLIIYRSKDSRMFVQEVLKNFEVDPASVPQGINIHLSIF